MRNMESILAQFGLKPANRDSKRLPSLNNEMYLVHADTGTVLVKFYRKKTRNMLEHEIRVISHLEDRGVAVAGFYTALDGNSLITCDGETVGLIRYLESRTLLREQVAEEQAQEIGRMVGLAHKALRSYPPSFIPRTCGCPTLDEVKANHRGWGQWIRNRTNPDEFDHRALQYIDFLLEISDSLEASMFERVAIQLVHCDLHLENVLFSSDGRLIAIIDWEWTQLRPRTWDLVYGIATMFLRPHLPYRENVRLIRPFLTGYHQVNPLTEAEIVSLPFMYLYDRLEDTRVWERHYGEGQTNLDHFATWDFEKLKWYRQYGGHLVQDLLPILQKEVWSS